MKGLSKGWIFGHAPLENLEILDFVNSISHIKEVHTAN